MSNFLWAKYHDGKHTEESIGINAYAYARFENYRFFRSGMERDDCMLHVTRHGAADVWNGKTMTRVERGSVTLYLTGEDHRYNCDRWELYGFHFYPSPVLLDLVKQYGVMHGFTAPSVFSETELERMTEIFAYPHLPVRLALHKCAILIEWIILACLVDRPEQRQPPQRMRLEDIEAYLSVHLAEHHRVASLARLVHLSPSRFAHLFREEYGKSVYAYITQARMKEAKLLLTRTDRTAAEIGAVVGYETPYHFYAAFKQATGFSPGRYRQEHRS